jgi:hypothetical protein
MANEYLVARGHPDLASNFDEHLSRFDELRREGELAKLKDKIQAAIDEYYEWGQFEVWWQNTARTLQLDLGVRSLTFSHNDDGLRRLLANYHRCASSEQRVERAWRLLVYCFNVDRHEEEWRRADWTPSDARGPHRPA